MDNAQPALAPTLAAISDPMMAGQPKSRGLLSDTLRRVARNPGALIGLIVLLAIVLLTLLAPVVAPYDPTRQDTQAIRLGPSLNHLFGTDTFGRDVLSRVLYGGRYSLPVGLVAVAVASLFGVLAGLAAGYYGRWVDTIIMRFVDILLALPGILMVMAIVAILGGGIFNLMIAVGLAAIPDYTRVVRGAVLSVRESEYVTATRVLGATGPRIMLRHILPNVLPPVIVLMTLGIAGAILLGSTLSFLGLGIQPPTPEWGNMLADGRTILRTAWWVSFFPGLAIAVTVLAINLLGDGLRDALDPRLRNR
ncbi:MAG TPA: ABC transporter permease [Thermomicrobiales bacterium]|jgi:peptide/nickel transport system permease protein|nr:ABC transporter permease [Thermomicrobiales bacterium]